MSRNFDSKNNTTQTIKRTEFRIKWETEAYPEGPIGGTAIKNTNFVERIHYGLIDGQNNSVIPNEDFMVYTQDGRVLDFVADLYSLMRLNWVAALQRGLASNQGSAFANLKMVQSYKNPKVRYGEYLADILRFYNETHIPNVIGIINITSYEDYVKNFFNFLFKNTLQTPITMTRWNTSTNSSILDTGLAFSYANIPYDADQRKINEIIDHPSFGYFKKLCLNTGFSILHNTPNVLVCDISSPASEGIKESYAIYTLSDLFDSRFIKTYTIDNILLYNNINIYYNRYARKHPQTKKVIWNGTCNKTVSEYIQLSTVEINNRPYTDLQELDIYCRIRNLEEGNPFSAQKVNNIYKKSKYFLKKVDKAEAMSYINSEYRDQVWNKDHGFHDTKNRIEGKANNQNIQPQTTPVATSTGGSSGGTSGGGSSY